MIRHSRNGLRAGKVSMAGFSVFLMKTACSTEKLEFHGFGRRAVMGHFDGGMISLDFSPGDAPCKSSGQTICTAQTARRVAPREGRNERIKRSLQ